MINRLYVIRCESPNKWYVGVTTRLPWERLAEHLNGEGSRWTREHGVSCMVFSVIVPNAFANKLESQMTAYLMARFGWANVRGGDHMYCGTDRTYRFWLPVEFRKGSFRDILKLREGSVTHLGPELGRLVDLFRRFRHAKHANHLHTEALA